MPQQKPRTNSLAFAKTDCHTCTANKRQCDRKRPRCSPCLGKGIVCGGYPMQLTWSEKKPILPRIPVASDDPFHLEPLSFRASLHAGDRKRLSKHHKPRKFRFMTEKSLNRGQVSTETHKSRTNPSSGSGGCKRGDSFQQTSINPIDQHAESDHLPGILDDIYDVNERNHTPDPFDLVSPMDILFRSLDRLSWSSADTTDIENTCTIDQLENDSMDNAAVIRNSSIPICQDQQQNYMILGSPIRHESLFGKFEALLNMYDQNFCIVPLSGDIPSNPFRCRLETFKESSALMHAVLAVSSYHAGRQVSRDDYSLVNIVNHQNTAIKLYDEEIINFTMSKWPQLLDTTMLLFMFKATQSAFSNWQTSISNALCLLKLSGGPQFWANNRKIQAQVVLLLWWDATIALLSRQGCLLPYSYFEALLSLEDDRYWSFYDLIGCPRELIVPLMQLASLAEENEKVLSMRWAKFDLTIIDEIQTSILNWKNSSLEIDDGLSEEQMHRQRDRWNCTEAWRYGLLIYITRVFLWNRNTKPPSSSRLAIYGRLILDHVNSCRRTSIVQKQAFFPLFLAGCETTDQFSRQSIREYCQYWDKFSGYNLFSTASSLLEEIWTEQARSCGDTVWWGDVIDRKQQAHQSHGASLQFCFG